MTRCESKPKMVVTLTPKRGIKMPPDVEKAFNEHYNTVHLPLMLKVPGITAIHRFEAEVEPCATTVDTRKEAKKYIVEYEIESIDSIEKTLTSPERKEALEDKVIFEYIHKYFDLERYIYTPQYSIAKHAR